MRTSDSDGTPRHHVAQLETGVVLHYLRCRPSVAAGGRLGEGAGLIVLLHGWPETGRAWAKVMPLLAAAGHDVVAPDLRGLGSSSRPASGYDKRTVAGDIRALVATLGCSRIACLVGHDIGAMVAFSYALRWPQELDRLALSEALLPGLGLEAMYTSTEPGRFPFMAFHLTPDIPEALVAGREAVYLGWFYRTLAYDKGALEPQLIADNVADYAQPGALRAGFEHYRAFPRDAEDNAALLKAVDNRLPVPVLTVCGAAGVGDGLARSLQPHAPQLRSVIVEECGHWIAAEQPRRLADEILAFCAADDAG